MTDNALSHCNPTDRNYSELTTAYDWFNCELFEDRLPRCLITLQRKSKMGGYFAYKRFGESDGRGVTDELAMNPELFRNNSLEGTLSILVHEMTHVEEAHFGKPSRGGYHNVAWVKLMLLVGLIPSHTGKPGGKQTGDKMSHYIEPGGRFEQSCKRLIETGTTVPYVDLWADKNRAKTKLKAASKSKYTCTGCSANVWGRPGMSVICGVCFANSGGNAMDMQCKG